MTLELAKGAVEARVRPERAGVAHSPLFQLTMMRMRELWRQPATLFWVFGFPLVLCTGLGIAFQSREPPPIVVGTAWPLAPSVDAALRAAGVTVRVLDAAALRHETRRGRIALTLVSPAEGGALEYHYDSARTEARLARAVVNEAIQAPAVGSLVPVRDKLVQEPGARYIDFLVPGLLGMNLMSGALWGIGWSLVDLRVRKLLKRLRVSPLSPSHLVFAIGLARTLVVPLEALVILGFGHLAFGLPIARSLPALGAAVFGGSLAFSGIAVLVGSRATNAETASGLVNLVMLPMFVLSGVFFSVDHFPELMRGWIRFLPLSALNDALRAVVLDGAEISAISTPLLILAGWATATFALGVRLFRWV